MTNIPQALSECEKVILERDNVSHCLGEVLNTLDTYKSELLYKKIEIEEKEAEVAQKLSEYDLRCEVHYWYFCRA